MPAKGPLSQHFIPGDVIFEDSEVSVQSCKNKTGHELLDVRCKKTDEHKTLGVNSLQFLLSFERQIRRAVEQRQKERDELRAGEAFVAMVGQLKKAGLAREGALAALKAQGTKETKLLTMALDQHYGAVNATVEPAPKQ